MKVLDLFSGLGGWAEPFRARGHEVITLDFEPKFHCDITADILEWDPLSLPASWIGADDLVIVASPPCEAFSVLQIGRSWTGPNDDPPHQPKTDQARLGVKIVERTREVIDILKPAFFVLENPRAKLRKLPVVADLPRDTVSFCRYGLDFMKPTDLFGHFPPSWESRGVCDSRNAPLFKMDGRVWVTDRANGNEPCHIQAVRGSTTGIQGKLSAAERAKIPFELALSICVAAELDLASGRVHDVSPSKSPVVEVGPLTLF